MCGAFGISTPEYILERYDVKPFAELKPRFNIRPAQAAPIITRNSPLVGRLATFGFIPSWSKEAKPKIMPINARAETVAVSGLFKGAFLHTRCLIPATHYFEWRRETVDGKLEKHPFAFKPEGEKIFSFAGIYSMREDAGKVPHYTFAIITTTPNKVARFVHDRMPAILHKDDEETWLDKAADPKELMHLLIPFDGELKKWEVSQDVNSFKNDNEDLLKEYVNSK